jgi:hypothetical protein
VLTLGELGVPGSEGAEYPHEDEIANQSTH